jgi:integrase
MTVRAREYLTAREIERLMATARSSSRYGHRDATMILIGYRHGLRASELCDLQWSQVELSRGRLHVRRAKNGSRVSIRCKVTRYALCGAYSASRGHRRTSS